MTALAGAGGRLADFVMLPNVVFPLFPVVDYATFGPTYYDRDALEIYRTGTSEIQRTIIARGLGVRAPPTRPPRRARSASGPRSRRRTG